MDLIARSALQMPRLETQACCPRVLVIFPLYLLLDSAHQLGPRNERSRFPLKMTSDLKTVLLEASSKGLLA